MLLEDNMKKVIFFIICCLVLNLFPFFVYADEKMDLIPNATSGLLMDADTGKIIFKKDINNRVAVASMTKMVAQIIIMEEIDKGTIKWDDVITVSKNAADMGGSQIYITEGEKITIEDLMKGISMASGNDATVAMAEVISGTEVKFVKRMNDKVKELGLKNTFFKNCTGLDEDGHYSTAYDMAIIARELVTKYPEILRFSSVYEDYLRENTDNKFWLVNTNKLVHFYEGADGLKTGHTDNAGYCLAATAKRNNVRLIAIVLGEKNATVRNNETMDLLDYGYQNIRVKKLLSRDKILKKLKVDKADNEIVEIKLINDLVVSEFVGDVNDNYDLDIQVDELKLPLKVGDVVGKVVVSSDGKVIKEGFLTVKKNVAALSFWELFIRELNDLFTGEF